MALVQAVSGTSDAASIAGTAGNRLVIVTGHRGAGETVTVSPNVGGGTWTQRPIQVTNPDDSNSRRGVALFELEISSSFATTAISVDWRDAGNNPVTGHIHIGEFDDAGTFADSSGADSDTATTTSQGTGSTGTVAAGDVLVVAGEVHRGTADPSWSTTSATGDVDLIATSGSGPNALVTSMGVLSQAGASAQTWSDTVTLSTARMCSALIAVWTTGSAGTTANAEAATATAAGQDATTAIAASAGTASATAAAQDATVAITPSAQTAAATAAAQDAATSVTVEAATATATAAALDATVDTFTGTFADAQTATATAAANDATVAITQDATANAQTATATATAHDASAQIAATAATATASAVAQDAGIAAATTAQVATAIAAALDAIAGEVSALIPGTIGPRPTADLAGVLRGPPDAVPGAIT